MEINLNTENFDKTVSEGVALVDFWATWCGPCKMLAPTIEDIAREYDGRVKVCKVDVDESPALAERFGIYSIPTLIVFKDGEAVDKAIGYRLKREVAQMLDNHLQ